MTYDQILEKIKTTDNQEKILAEIDILLTSLYQDKGFGFDSTLSHSVRAWFSALLREQIGKVESDKETYLLALKQKILDLPKVYLTLAFEPSQDAQGRIVGLLRAAVGQDVVVSFSYDPNLIGGVEVIFRGEYRDFSFKRIFEKEFERSREDFLRSLSAIETGRGN